MGSKKEHFGNHFVDAKFFRIITFVDNLVDFLELLMFINASLPSVNYLMIRKGNPNMKKNQFVRYSSHNYFQKNLTNDLN